MTPKLVYIEGNIGSGKTTFISLLPKYLDELKEDLKYSIVTEPVAKWMEIKDETGIDLLTHFYNDQNKWSFPFQMNSFISRVNEIDTARKENAELDIIFVERSVYTDKYCFAQNCYDSGKMTKIEFEIYCKWHQWLCENFNTEPYGYIYLKTSPEISYSRIKKRLRAGEEEIPLDYLTLLHNKHNDWLEDEHRSLVIDVSKEFKDDNELMRLWSQSIIDCFK